MTELSDKSPPRRPVPPPLTSEQGEVLRQIRAWEAASTRQSICTRAAGVKPYFTFGGFAGVGKSTLLMHFVVDAMLPTTAVVSFTGKAVNVLRRKGLRNAKTVHSFLYTPEDVSGAVFFRQKSPSDFLKYQLIVVDEAQTLNQALFNDLIALGIPTLFVGDMGQLEPIGENPGLMASPDVKLTTVHRQAEGSPIIRFSQSLREGDGGAEETPEVLEFGEYHDAVDLVRAGKVDVAICGYNNTRRQLNDIARDGRGFSGPLPVVGEQVICLQNNSRLGVFNGMTAVVTAARKEMFGRVGLDLVLDDGQKFENLPAATAQFGKEKMEFAKTSVGLTYWDFGYAVTVYKAMGSEWDRVAVVEQCHEDTDWRRWSYTAATRAAKYLFYSR